MSHFFIRKLFSHTKPCAKTNAQNCCCCHHCIAAWLPDHFGHHSQANCCLLSFHNLITSLTPLHIQPQTHDWTVYSLCRYTHSQTQQPHNPATRHCTVSDTYHAPYHISTFTTMIPDANCAVTSPTMFFRKQQSALDPVQHSMQRLHDQYTCTRINARIAPVHNVVMHEGTWCHPIH